MLKPISFFLTITLGIASLLAPDLRAQIALGNSPCFPGKASSADPEAIKKQAEKGDKEAQFAYGTMLYLGCNGVQADHAAAAHWWQRASEQGQPFAMTNLGQLLLHGDGVSKDVEGAIRLFQEAGEAGAVQGFYSLSHMYALGDGVPQDLAQEAKWYRVLAERGVVDAMWMMGKYYDEGHGVPENEQQAIYWWKKAAERGHKLAATKLAEAQAQSGGVEAANAVQELRKQASGGNGEAAFELAQLYVQGNGVPLDEKEAKHWFEVAAQNDYGRIEVGNRLWAGRGVEADPARAFYWYQKAGCEWAGYQLGRMYELGQGTPQDYAKAADCYRQGMERSALARLGLADLTEKGQGVPKDEAAALKLYRETAERVIGGVAFEIAMNFDLGRGLPNDLPQAARWWRISASYHNGGAALNLARKYTSGSGVPKNPVDAYVWTGLGSDITYYAKSAHEDMQQQLSSAVTKHGEKVIAAYRKRKKHFGAYYEKSNPVVKMSEPDLRAAASKNIDALFSLAYRFEIGGGMAADVPEAIRRYRQATFEASGDLYNALGKEYEKGRRRAKDMKVAVNLYRSAAEKGSLHAQYRLGLAYQTGVGVDRDLAQAYKWFLLASDGNTKAKVKIKQLKPLLTPQQITAAGREATDIRLCYAR